MPPQVYTCGGIFRINHRFTAPESAAIDNPPQIRYDGDNGTEVNGKEHTMEIGNQIKQLRLRRGITQEEMARHFGLTAQAISKWERGTAAPDIAMLPGISAYFGCTIDELFSLSDDTRMERIQNMIWDVRYLNPADVENAQQFLLEKARREPNNGRPHELLADMENHLAKEHHERAAEYAKEALRRDPNLREAHAELTEAMGGKCGDWNVDNHHALIAFYKDYITQNPTCRNAYLWLMDQLLDDERLEEARHYLQAYARIDNSFRVPMFEGKILWGSGDRNGALAVWEQMLQCFPDEWAAWMTMGDFMARCARYEDAKAYYRKSLEIMKPPRYVDSLECIAQICEIQGDYTGAIAALEEELELDASDWNFTTGETADVVRREIERLKKKLETA